MKNQLKQILVCPKCLGSVQFNKDIILCLSCGLNMHFVGGKPNMTIDTRLEKTETNSSPVENQHLTIDLGAGARSTGAINVDIRPLNNIDIIANVLYLPFASESIERVVLNQVIEHFNHQEAQRLLTELKRVTIPGGVIEIWTPNFLSIGILMAWLFGRIDWSNPDSPSIYTPLTGGQEYPENVHKSYWTADLLKLYIERAGLVVEEISTDQRFSTKFHPGWIIRALTPKRRGQLYLKVRKLPKSGKVDDLKPMKITDPWLGYKFPQAVDSTDL